MSEVWSQALPEKKIWVAILEVSSKREETAAVRGSEGGGRRRKRKGLRGLVGRVIRGPWTWVIFSAANSQ